MLNKPRQLMVVVFGDNPPLRNKFPKNHTAMKDGMGLNMCGSFIDVEVKKNYAQCEMRNRRDIFPWDEGTICGR